VSLPFAGFVGESTSGDADFVRPPSQWKDGGDLRTTRSVDKPDGKFFQAI
jgi:hypothetical protein